MPAPRRPGILQQQTPNESVYTTPGSLVETGPSASKPIIMSEPGTTVSTHEMDMMKVSQTVMMVFGFLTIWSGVFIIAFDTNATNQNMLVVFLGGLASFLATMGIIEGQSRKNGGQLYDLHNYFLGIAFFFSTIAAMWGARYLMALATGSFEVTWFGDPGEYTNTDWAPNENGIYAQTLAVLGVTALHLALLNRYEGEKNFGFGVATYAPMIVLLGGVGPWIRWSDDVVSYELGISMLLLTLVSMEVAVRSNRSINFAIVAFMAGLMPIVYELINTNAPPGGEGGALSLMVFIVALQGYYAAREDLNKEVMERASAFLIAQVVLVIMLTRMSDLNLILGPVNAAEVPELQAYLSIPVALWCTVLLAYFPAVLMNRVPWMPIGLAISLTMLPYESSTVPWLLTTAMIPYMVFVSKVARPWVVNTTLVIAAGAYLFTDVSGFLSGLNSSESFGGMGAHILIPFVLLFTAEMGRRENRLQTSTSLVMITCVLMSRTFWDPVWFVPWAFIGYMLAVTVTKVMATPNPDEEQRRDTSISILFAGAVSIYFGVSGELTYPTEALNELLRPAMFGSQYLLLSIAFYVVSKYTVNHEMSLFGLGQAILGSAGQTPTYDQESNSWVVKTTEAKPYDDDDWSPLERISLITAFVMFSFSVFSIEQSKLLEEPYWVGLMAIPVAMTVKDISDMEVISSRTRSWAVYMLLLMSLPIGVMLSWAIADSDVRSDIVPATVLLDLIIISGPLAVNAVINRRGIDEGAIKKRADAEAYIGLLFLSMLDSSGGLLFFTLSTFVAMKTLQYKHYFVSMLVPIAYFFRAESVINNVGVTDTLLTRLPDGLQELLRSYDGIGVFVGLAGMIVTVHMVLAVGIMARDREHDTSLTTMIAMGWLSMACLSFIPTGGWLPAIATIIAMIFAWYQHRSHYLPALLGILFVCLAIGFEFSGSSGGVEGFGVWSTSALITGLIGSLLLGLDGQGLLFRNEADGEDDLRIRKEVPELLLQITSIAYFLGFDATYGIGPIIGATMYAKTSLRSRSANQLILFPVLSTFAVYNAMAQTTIGDEELRTMVTGVLLVAQGVFMSFATQREDDIYDSQRFEWPSDDEFFGFMDRLGLTGSLYTLIGVSMTLNGYDPMYSYLIATLYLIVIGVQGFSEQTASKWRRTIGGYGSILMSILFASQLTSAIYQGLAVIFVGMVALGFTFLYTQRTGMGATVMTGEEGPVTVQATSIQPQVESQPTQSADDEVEALTELPDPVKAVNRKQNSLLEKADRLAAMSRNTEESKPPATSRPQPSSPPAPAPNKSVLMTETGLGVELPHGTLENILRAIEATPHEGYMPVLSFATNGQIMLNFEEK